MYNIKMSKLNIYTIPTPLVEDMANPDVPVTDTSNHDASMEDTVMRTMSKIRLILMSLLKK